MKRDLPSPAEILEELADKVAGQIDRQAPVGFDNALKEMTRFHRFLLSLNASRTPDGAAFNYAEVAGNAWNPPHREWVRQYGRLMGRAADRIPDDDHFIRALAHVPLRLLPGRDDAELPAKVLEVLLDLGPMMMHRIEAWVTKRTSADTPVGESATPRLVMAASDAKAYANVLPEIIGGWESLLQVVPSIFQWREGRERTPAQEWSAYRASWPFLWQHLSNTAHCLAVAVWNEDVAAAGLFREALVRWREVLSYRLQDHAELRWRRLVYPDLLNDDWETASTRAAPLAYGHMPVILPTELFTTILRNSHGDVLLLTAALLLRWTIEEKQSSNIGASTAAELLRRECSADDGIRPRVAPPDLRAFVLDLLRIELSGSGYRDGSYSAQLDTLVAMLDNMTERRVVPGRVFTPTTSHGRGDLRLAIGAMLISAAAEGGDNQVEETVGKLAAEEHLLPQGDRSCRDMVDGLRAYRDAVDQHWPQIATGFGLLKPGHPYEAAASVLRNALNAGEAVVERERLARLKARPVDPATLEEIRAKAEAEILKSPAKVPFFRETAVARGPYDPVARDRALRFNDVAKAGLIKPPMAPPSLNFDATVASAAADAVGRHAWSGFKERPRTSVDVTAGAESETFWTEIAAYIEQVGPEPVLVVSRESEGRALRLLRRQPDQTGAKLRIEQQYRHTPGATYIATVNGVEVFGADFPQGTSWLFSARAVSEIIISPLTPESPSSTLIGIDYRMESNTSGVLIITFRPTLVCNDLPIFEFQSPVPEPELVEGEVGVEEEVATVPRWRYAMASLLKLLDPRRG